MRTRKPGKLCPACRGTGGHNVTTDDVTTWCTCFRCSGSGRVQVTYKRKERKR